ncbi:hypothetical protein AAF712_011190 [Marasmius tenuissimus]|uniref:Uncharacterized protein n=1 Tax=Marasmius tenuissimus TaxID=585030 RepID=A0ABR2ZLN2_9AGAR|nr:hypothetical protein PM082_016076 [Marasmius tenuissimus]
MHFLAGLFLFVSAVLAGPISSPLPAQSDLDTTPVGFNDWQGFSQLDGFDDFRGVDNFDGSQNAQVVVIQQQQQVCQTRQIQIVQQRLVILQEMAKRIVTQQICEVEVQTIVLEQFQSGLRVFQQDVQRVTTRQVGFDEEVARKITEVVNADGTLSDKDLGINGEDVGKNTVVVVGDNWDDEKSPEQVKKAKEDAEKAAAEANKEDPKKATPGMGKDGAGKNETESELTRRGWFF